MLALFLVLANGAFPAGSAPPVDDRLTYTAAVAALRQYAPLTIFDDVWVAVTDGIVTLGGKVTSPIKKHDIAKRLGGVAGVRRVENTIAVLPVSRFDDDLRERIARAIYGNANFWNYAVMPNPPIHIIVEHSRVTLTGIVRTDADRVLAGALAMQSDALSVAVELKTEAEVKGADD